MNEYLVFKVCNFYYAIDSSIVQRVEKYNGEEEVINLRENFFDEKGGKYIINFGEKKIVVDFIEGIFKLKKEILNTIFYSNIVEGVAKLNDKLVIILSLEELFRYEEQK